eukprot:7957516-Pyramimonas_sp.AAC.1
MPRARSNPSPSRAPRRSSRSKPPWRRQALPPRLAPSAPRATTAPKDTEPAWASGLRSCAREASWPGAPMTSCAGKL